MSEKEIADLHKILKTRRQVRLLWRELRLERPTLSDSTVRRAFKVPTVVTDTCEWVREKAVQFIAQDDKRIAAMRSPMAAQISQNIAM